MMMLWRWRKFSHLEPYNPYYHTQYGEERKDMRLESVVTIQPSKLSNSSRSADWRDISP